MSNIKNLPSSKPVPSKDALNISNLPDTPDRDPSEIVYNMATSMFSRIPGGTEDYAKYLGDRVPMWHGKDSLDEARARNQKFLPTWRNAIAQAAFGTVLGGTLENIGNLAELYHIGRVIHDTEYEWGKNMLQQLGHNLNEWARDRHPVYQTKRAQEGGIKALVDKTYYPSHFPSIMSSVALMVPSALASRITLGVAGKVARSLGATLGKSKALVQFGSKAKDFNSVTRFITSDVGRKSIVTGLYSRHMYSYTESMDNYRTAYDNYKSLNFTSEEAHELAAKSASHNYKLGYLNLWKDIAAWSLIYKWGDAANKANNMQMAAAAHATQYKGVSLLGKQGVENLAKAKMAAKITPAKLGKDLIKQSLLEGFEEYNIQWQKKEGHRVADIAAGIIEKQDFNTVDKFFKRIAEHTVDPHTFDSFFWGSVGGFTFGLVGLHGFRATQRGQMKAAEQNTKRIINNLENLSTQYQRRSELLEMGAFDQASILDATMEANMLANALSAGTASLDVEILRNLSQHTNEQLKQTGFPEGIQAELASLADRMEAGITKYNQVSKTNFGHAEFDTLIATTKVANEYVLDRLNVLKKEYEKQNLEISSRESLPDYMNPAAKDKLDRVTTLKAIQRTEGRTNSRIGEIQSQIIGLTERLKTKGLGLKEGLELNRQLTVNRRMLESANSHIEYLGKLKAELNSSINAINSVLKADVNLSDINDYISKNSDVSTTELGFAIENINAYITKQEALIAKLDTAEGQQELVNTTKEELKNLRNERRSDFETALADTKSLAQLERLHKDYDMEFKELYDTKKKELEKIEALEKEEAKFNTEFNSLVDKLDKGTIQEVPIELTKAEQKFYDNNKEVIDKALADRATKRETPTTEGTPAEVVTETVNSKDNILSDITFDEELTVTLNAIVAEDGSIKPLISDMFGDTTVPSKQQYLLGVFAYLRGVIDHIKANSKDFNHSYTAILKQYLNDHESVVKSILGNDYKQDYSLIDANPTSEMIAVIGENLGRTATMMLSLNGLTNNLKIKFKTIQEGFTNKTDAIKAKFITLVDDAKNLLEDADKTKESKDLAGIIAKKNKLVTDLAEILNEFYSDITEPQTVTLKSLYELFIDLNMIDFLKENHNIFRQIFDLGATHSAKIIKASESNNNLYIDFRYTQALRNITDPNFIDKFIAERIGNIADQSRYKGTYVYMHDLVELTDTNLVSNDIVDKVETFVSLEKGDVLNVIADPNYIDPRYNDQTNKDRNTNPNTVPLKVVSNKTGKEVEIGFVQSLDAVHDGIPYKDSEGNFNPFSAIVNQHDIDILFKYKDKLKEIFSSTSYTRSKDKQARYKQMSALPDELQKVLSKLVLHNRDKSSVISYGNINHILQPLFYNSPELSSLTPTNIKKRFNNHHNIFKQDYDNSVTIRNKIAKGEKVELKISYKSASPRFLSSYSRTLASGIAPINYNGKRQIVLGRFKLDQTGDRSSDVFDTRTGQKIPIVNPPPSHHTKTYTIHEVSPGVYMAFTATENNLNNRYGAAIIKDILERLKTVSLNASKEAINNFDLYTRSYIKPNKIGTTASNENFDNPDTFNFKANRWSDTETSITFKSEGVFYEIKYNNKKDTFQMASHTSITTDGQLLKRTFNNASLNEIVPFMKSLKRGNYIDKATNTFGGIGEFTAFGKTYASYTDFLIETDGFITNMDSVTNENGEVITNFVPVAEKGKSPYALHADVSSEVESAIKTETTTKTPTPDILNSEVSDYLGKSLSELMADPLYEPLSLLNEIVEELGITITFNNTVTKGKTELSQASIIESEAGVYKVNLHKGFIYDKSGNPLTKYNQASIIMHEVLHPIIEAKESKLTKEQSEIYLNSLKDFRDSLREYTSKENNTLSDFEKGILSNYLSIADTQGKHSETITYAFANPELSSILSKLSKSENTSQGFWNKLLNIVADLFGIDKSSKLGELASILDRVIEVSNKQDITEAAQTEVKKDTSVPKSITPTKPGKPIDHLSDFDSSDLSSSEQLFNKYEAEILQRYNLNKAEFIAAWDQLSPTQRIQEIKCL